MYESFFGLTERPFFDSPRVHRYVPISATEDARRRLERMIERGDGTGLIIGPPGSGKTLLLHVVAEQFRGPLVLAHLEAARLCSRRALLQAVLFALDLPYRNLEEGELRFSLIDFLKESPSSCEGMLLLVDEAHTLPLRLLEEIRVMTNVVYEGQPRVRAVLAGSSFLEEHFAHPRLDSFNQRVTTRCYLAPLDRSETIQYVRAQLAASGADAGSIFSEDALLAVYQATDGIVRLVNQVCDRALLLAAEAGVRPLSAANVERAWADLQQLPAPATGSSSASQGNTEVVEFGSLDADDHEADDHAADCDGPGGDSTHDPLGEDDFVEIGAESECTEYESTGRESSGRESMADDSALHGAAHEPPPAVSFPGSDDEEATDAAVRGDTWLDDAAEDERGDRVDAFEPAGTILALVDGEASQPICDPFDEPFAEEEVVVDHYASLENDQWRPPRWVTSSESSDFARVLDEVHKNMRTASSCQPLAASAEAPPATSLDSAHTACQNIADSIQDIPFEFADRQHVLEKSNRGAAPAAEDPVRPELGTDSTTGATTSEAGTPERYGSDRGEVAPSQSDDDILIIEDEPLEESALAGRVERQEYGQLFSRLRRGM